MGAKTRMEYVVQGVVAFRLVLVLVALTRLLAAGEPGARILDAEAVRRLLQRSARADAGLGITLTETVEHIPTEGKTVRWVRHWRVRGDAYRGPTSCLTTKVGGESAVYVVRRKAEIYHVYKHSDSWSAFTDKVPDPAQNMQHRNFPILSVYQRALRPFNRGAWDGCLKRDSILETAIDKDSVTAVFVWSHVADAWARGRKMYGPIGWRCTFKKLEGRYVLE